MPIGKKTFTSFRGKKYSGVWDPQLGDSAPGRWRTFVTLQNEAVFHGKQLGVSCARLGMD